MTSHHRNLHATITSTGLSIVILRLLLDHGFDLNAHEKSIWQRTRVAAMSGDVPFARFLHEKGMEIILVWSIAMNVPLSESYRSMGKTLYMGYGGRRASQERFVECW